MLVVAAICILAYFIPSLFMRAKRDFMLRYRNYKYKKEIHKWPGKKD